MTNKKNIGGIVHTYIKYDPMKFPSPTQPPPDFVTPLMDQMLQFGSRRQLTEEELARAVRLDPEQFKNMGPGIDQMKKILEERKRRILETYETKTVVKKARKTFHNHAKNQPKGHPLPDGLKAIYKEAIQQEQLYDLERIYYKLADDTSPLAQFILQLLSRLGNKYQVDELAANYHFTGDQSLTIPEALEVKEELEKIDELLRQLEEARATAQISILDLDTLGEYMDDETMQSLEEMKRVIENYVREAAERQGLESNDGAFQLTPQAYRVFQGKLLEKIFDQLKESKSGQHQANISGEGAVELQATKPYEFGDSLTHMDIPQTFINAMLRGGRQLPIRLKSEDIEIHKTRNNPKSATVVIMDMSGSMRYDGQYVNVKRMALALDGLIRSEYPGDYLNFIEMFTFGKVRRRGEIIDMMPKHVTIHDPFVHLKVDMSRPDVSEHMVHQHFTNIQHSLRLARQLLAGQDTPNKQVILITDGLPTAHFDDNTLFMLYPPHRATEEATMREAAACANSGITINTFLVPSWSQSEEDIQFAHRLSEQTAGRVFFTAGGDLDRFVVWDYLSKKREIL